MKRKRSIAIGAFCAGLSALVIAACGSGDSANTSEGATGPGPVTGAGAGDSSSTGSTANTGGSSTSSQGGGSTTNTTAASGGGGGSQTSTTGAGGSDACGGTCTNGATCGSANGIPVCRTPTGIPVFTHVFVIMMENLSRDSLEGDLDYAPNLGVYQDVYASGDDYHGVTHPSLPNYIALTSGDYWGIGCDCKPDPNAGSCGALSCSLLTSSCGCNQAVDNIADQLEAAGKTWRALGEDMGTSCNQVTAGNYAVRHVPFIYYDSIRDDANRCNKNVIDFSNLDVSDSAPHLQFIAPNLVDDMHDPLVSINGHEDNIANGDTWVAPVVDQITSSDAFASGGLLVIVWDEDDFSGVPNADDPIPIFVFSPYAKSGGFVSHVTANHYSLLATIEDSFGLPRLANAIAAQPLTDYFPDN